MEDSVPEFYLLKSKSIRGSDFDFSLLQGKVVLIVNVASKCGFTGQYRGLQALSDEFKGKPFVILGFPCDQFGHQEPAAESEIESFCMGMFGVTFPMMSKVDVNGPNSHAVYRFLKKNRRQWFMEQVKWNFEKFLIDSKGKVVQRFSSMADPKKYIEPVVRKLVAEAEATAAT